MKPQIPGYLGNILLYPQDVASALAAVSRTLEVDGESYCETAKCILEYAGGDRAAKKISKALKVLPKALQQVKNNGASLLTLSLWSCCELYKNL